MWLTEFSVGSISYAGVPSTERTVGGGGRMGSATLDARRKRVLFRCCHRGMQETDLLLGGFARRHLAELGDEQVGHLEALLAQPDNDLFDWITGKAPVPAAFDNDVMTLLRNFRYIP